MIYRNKTHFLIGLVLLLLINPLMTFSEGDQDLKNELQNKEPLRFKTTVIGGDAEKQIGYFLTLLQKNPNSALANQGLCGAYSASNPKQAVHYCTKAIELNGEDSLSYQNLGGVYLNLGLTEQAISALKKSIEIAPQEGALAYTDLCGAYLALKQPDTAIEQCQKALKLNSKIANIHANLGQAYSQKGLLDDALSEYKQALNLDPKLFVAYIDMGTAYGKKQQFSEGIPYLQKAIALDPHNFLGEYDLGTLYLKSAEFPLAIKHLERATELNPGEKLVLYQLSVAYCLNQQRDQADKEYEKLKQFSNVQNLDQLQTIFSKYCPQSIPTITYNPDSL